MVEIVENTRRLSCCEKSPFPVAAFKGRQLTLGNDLLLYKPAAATARAGRCGFGKPQTQSEACLHNAIPRNEVESIIPDRSSELMLMISFTL